MEISERTIQRWKKDYKERGAEGWKRTLKKSQFVTSNEGRGGRRYQPLVFTENGVAMLSSLLKSETAIDVNITIMRIFTKLRSFLVLEKELFSSRKRACY